jgi:hypothetical protein
LGNSYPNSCPALKLSRITFDLYLKIKIKIVMKQSLYSIVTLFCFTGLILLSACGEDELPPNTAVIKGTIEIENTDVWTTWVDSGEVQLTIFPEFSLNPPSGWGSIPDGTFGPGVPGGTFALGAPFNSQNPIILEYEPGKSTYDYELEVDPGTYSALALGFRHNFVNDASRRTATLGVYYGNPATVSHGVVLKAAVGGGNIITLFDFPAPSVFSIEEGETVELDFKADFSFVNQWYR